MELSIKFIGLLMMMVAVNGRSIPQKSKRNLYPPVAPSLDNLPGIPGKDYPTLSNFPETRFSCSKQAPGYYADLTTNCQAFHVCQRDGRHNRFFCPNGTLFNQEFFICDWWYNVECVTAPTKYYMNSLFHPDLDMIDEYGKQKKVPLAAVKGEIVHPSTVKPKAFRNQYEVPSTATRDQKTSHASGQLSNSTSTGESLKVSGGYASGTRETFVSSTPGAAEINYGDNQPDGKSHAEANPSSSNHDAGMWEPAKVVEQYFGERKVEKVASDKIEKTGGSAEDGTSPSSKLTFDVGSEQEVGLSLDEGKQTTNKESLAIELIAPAKEKLKHTTYETDDHEQKTTTEMTLSGKIPSEMVAEMAQTSDPKEQRKYRLRKVIIKRPLAKVQLLGTTTTHHSSPVESVTGSDVPKMSELDGVAEIADGRSLTASSGENKGNFITPLSIASKETTIANSAQETTTIITVPRIFLKPIGEVKKFSGDLVTATDLLEPTTELPFERATSATTDESPGEQSTIESTGLLTTTITIITSGKTLEDNPDFSRPADMTAGTVPPTESISETTESATEAITDSLLLSDLVNGKEESGLLVTSEPFTESTTDASLLLRAESDTSDSVDSIQETSFIDVPRNPMSSVEEAAPVSLQENSSSNDEPELSTTPESATEESTENVPSTDFVKSENLLISGFGANEEARQVTVTETSETQTMMQLTEEGLMGTRHVDSMGEMRSSEGRNSLRAGFMVNRGDTPRRAIEGETDSNGLETSDKENSKREPIDTTLDEDRPGSSTEPFSLELGTIETLKANTISVEDLLITKASRPNQVGHADKIPDEEFVGAQIVAEPSQKPQSATPDDIISAEVMAQIQQPRSMDLDPTSLTIVGEDVFPDKEVSTSHSREAAFNSLGSTRSITKLETTGPATELLTRRTSSTDTNDVQRESEIESTTGVPFDETQNGRLGEDDTTVPVAVFFKLPQPEEKNQVRK